MLYQRKLGELGKACGYPSTYDFHFYKRLDRYLSSLKFEILYSHAFNWKLNASV